MAKEKSKTNLKALTVDELKNNEKQLREQLFKLKIQKATGQLADTSTLKKSRKEIARILTGLTLKSKSLKSAHKAK